MRLLTRTRDRRIGYAVVAAATFAVVGTAISVAVLTAGASSKAEAAPPAHDALTTGFIDKSSSDYFRIELDQAGEDYGHFVVAIPGVGLAWAHGAATVSPHSATATTLRYDGDGYLDPQAVLDTEFGVNYRPQGTITDVPVKLHGQIDTAHGTGSINVWVDGVHYHLFAAPPTSGADPAAAKLTDALRTQDWDTVYAMADDSLRNDMTPAQFVTWIKDQLGADGTVDDVTITGATTYTTSSAGISYANIPVHEAVTVNGRSQAADATLILINDKGTWRWLTTESPAK